ncbi:TOBE domain-containing protein [Ethanoligenens harbinense]|uniref:TOBE domain-containing protein n=1 Tax=Ethanoligenens harbinense (strain DSM 18485 / JCM 12961 / CGMCC 1.5033 / YUAN-3) TaxID=663278 RepID=E6U9A1_ETHHY|nr:TOBE domain-containing protein [Ethanoligenens harbinense]ADU27260.1 TOBE domain-containing protein [Ethanoligenens harbinense YUAN-3]AVQ96325.1 transporter [Ethanoligenens harbinense YUAN-3]AYF38983.1 transporter [Ethanoligenens harbinense]AYF41736.1 transporter [Ethanoligenens harbinense]QCN92566.1 transporter [Ethanoligenens harbinense]
MTISARNQFKGTVESVQEGAVNALVHVKTAADDIITATVSLEAVKELGLAAGKEATAVVKATEVLVGIGDAKLSARNQLAGEVTKVQEGAVNAIVTIKTEGGTEIEATISLEAVKELGLAAGVKAKAIIKATAVIIAI